LSNKWTLRPSEIDIFLTCQRKWGFLYLDNIEPPPSPSIKLGIAVHKVLENYLINNEIDYQTTEGQVIKPGIRFLPNKLPKNHVEKKFFLPIDDYVLTGTPDFFMDLGDNVWLLGDHKTCSSLRSALSSNQLKTNIQANIYAHWLFQKNNAELVKLRWVYYRTKGTAQAQCVEAELTLQDNAKNCETIFALAKEIINLKKIKPSSMKLPKNLSACFKYGRCPFYAQCKRTPETTTVNYKLLDAPQFKTITREDKERAVPSSCEPKQKSFHLYIDCVPTKNESAYERIIELSDLLKPVLSKIQTEKELSHYRLAGYGAHVGLIANYLSEHLRDTGYDNRTAILSSLKTPEGCDTLQTLTAAAGQVVRGF
jgi:hypothetical protein